MMRALHGIVASSFRSAFAIINSGLFASADPDRLYRTPSAGDRKTFTVSMWVKRVSTGTFQTLFGAGTTTPAYDGLRFTDTNAIQFFQEGAAVSDIVSSNTFSSTSSFYHIVFHLNSTAGTTAKLWVDGVEETMTGTFPTNVDGRIFSAIVHGIGAQPINSTFGLPADMYIANVDIVEGLALSASDFGYDDSGTWRAKAYAGSYGTEGSKNNFENISNLGEDSSGNGNDWTNYGVAQTTTVP